LTHNEETFWTFKWTKESPHSTYFYIYTFEKTDRGGRKEIFKVFGLLGEGTFGQVALAKKKSTGGHSSSEEVVAIKFVPNNKVSAIEKEVLFRAVGHPFLVQLLTYFQTKESLWYVMEDVEGGTLRSFLSRR
jgi:serine/threonine protein kinase